MIDYMRLSITDRCNLRCKYCMPEEGLESLAHSNILRYEEILLICKAAVKAGICNIKVTGGELLVRKGCIGFLRELKALGGIESVTITTNGILLEPYVPDLVEMKINGINISLNSLSAETYKQLTRKDEFAAVWRSLNKAVEAGLRVKINCVPIAGQNDTEILSFARLAENMPIDVRFIELMPTSAGEKFTGVKSEEILGRINEAYPDLTQDTQRRGPGPAKYYKSSKMRGSIGLIDAVSSCFCPECNRVRLTSDGFLKLCLFHDEGLDLRELIRSGADEHEVGEAFATALLRKPGLHMLGSQSGIKDMSRIGG
ncbi:MAG: GTP 3',8-cyclase MoaA [Defluviitaleaceae bacterium]|nr:GTP 3',8-cyclase MoaA [Defluviitaleaceae bacterium]